MEYLFYYRINYFNDVLHFIVDDGDYERHKEAAKCTLHFFITNEELRRILGTTDYVAFMTLPFLRRGV